VNVKHGVVWAWQGFDVSVCLPHSLACRTEAARRQRRHLRKFFGGAPDKYRVLRFNLD
jgi:hypothetical protein